MPQVSVVMATYNNALFIQNCIDSILQQQFTDFEFIIINDASTDNTSQILETYNEPRLKIYHNLENLGLAGSLNLGLQHATGAYIARMDGDDITLSGRLAAQVAFLDTYPNVGVVGTERLLLYENEKVYTPYSPLRTTHNCIAWRVFMGGAFCHPTLMLRRSILETVGGYDPTLIYGGEDSDLYVRLLGKTTFANLATPYLLYRQHKDSITARNIDKRHLTQRTRHTHATALVGRPFNREMFNDIAAAWYGSYTLSAARAHELAMFLFDLFHAMQEAGYFVEDDMDAVRAELFEHFLRLGRRSQNTAPHWRTWGRRLVPKRLRRIVKRRFTGQPLDDFLRSVS